MCMCVLCTPTCESISIRFCMNFTLSNKLQTYWDKSCINRRTQKFHVQYRAPDGKISNIPHFVDSLRRLFFSTLSGSVLSKM